MSRAYEELVDFIASGSTATEVARFSPSQKAKERVWGLLKGAKAGTLSPSDRADLEHYLHVEHIMRLARAKARSRVTHE